MDFWLYKVYPMNTIDDPKQGSFHADIIKQSVQELREKHENNPHKECCILLCYLAINNLPKYIFQI
jgi:hypothetical protein